MKLVDIAHDRERWDATKMKATPVVSVNRAENARVSALSYQPKFVTPYHSAKPDPAKRSIRTPPRLGGEITSRVFLSLGFSAVDCVFSLVSCVDP